MNGLEGIIDSEITDVHLSSGSNEIIPKEELLMQLSKASESPEVKSSYQTDMNSIIGRILNKCLDWEGLERKEPNHYTYLNLPEDVGAATITFNNGTVVLAYNSKYRGELLNNDLKMTYVNLHEQAHIRGINSEYGADGIVKNAARMVRKSLIPYIHSVGNQVKGLYSGVKETLSNVKETVSKAIKIENHAIQRQQMLYET